MVYDPFTRKTERTERDRHSSGKYPVTVNLHGYVNNLVLNEAPIQRLYEAYIVITRILISKLKNLS